ncbi:hypothetical protein ACWEQL_29500 [Kitasatospora sp. NPDC004240]
MLAAGGALIAQLWGLGLNASGAYAVTADPAPGPAGGIVRPLNDGRTEDGGSAPRDGRRPSAGRALGGGPAGSAGAGDPWPGSSGAPGPPGTSDPARPGQAAAPGLLGALTGSAASVVPVPGPANPSATAGEMLQDRIKAGALPLPGSQGADPGTVPDAFVIASGLLSATPAQGGRDPVPRAPGDDPPTDADTADRARSEAGAAGGSVTVGQQRGPAAPPPSPGPAGVAGPGGQPGGSRPGAVGATGEPVGATGVSAQRTGDREFALPGADAAAVTRGAGTGPAVLAPITAGLLLTGAAMYKHRGLPRGH